jgi:hypothetical protein
MNKSRIVLKQSNISKIYIYIDSNSLYSLNGRIYNISCKDAILFTGLHELLMKMEEIFDRLSMPQEVFQLRSFKQMKKPTKESVSFMGDMEISLEHEQKATFIIHIKFRQNATWQGTIKWVEENKKQDFRSELEMIKLMDNALSQTSDKPESIEWVDIS